MTSNSTAACYFDPTTTLTLREVLFIYACYENYTFAKGWALIRIFGQKLGSEEEAKNIMASLIEKGVLEWDGFNNECDASRPKEGINYRIALKNTSPDKIRRD